MGKAASFAFPILGGIFGGPLGASILGGAIGTTAGTMVGAGLGAGLGSYATGGNFLDGAVMGGLGAGVGQIFSGGGSALGGGGGEALGGASEAIGGGGEALGASLGGGGNSLALPAGVAGAGDAIEGIDALMRAAPGATGATSAAQSFGFGSVESLLGAANPSFVNVSPFFQQASNSLQDMGMSSMAKAVGGGMSGIADATGLSSVQNFLGGGGGGGAGNSISRGVGLMQGFGSIYSGLEARKQAKLMQEMARQEMERNASMTTKDEMAPYRAGYAAQLQALMNDPSSISQIPGYAAGLQAINRSQAAQGFTGSGNAQAALQKYGGDFYGQQVERLRQLASGGGYNPSNSNAIQGYMQGANLNGNGLASIGYGTRQLGF